MLTDGFCVTMFQIELGNQLRRARESKGFTLEDAEKTTGIRKRFLQAMEEGRFAELPGQIQARGFLRSYAGYLGLNPEEMLALYDRQTRPAQLAAPQAASPARPATERLAPPQPLKPPPVSAPQPAAQPAPSAAPQPVTPLSLPLSQPAGPPERLARLSAWLTPEVGLLILAGILLICVAILAALFFVNPEAGQLEPTPGPISTRTRTVSASVVPAATPGVTAALTPTALMTKTTGYVQVALAATEHVWVRVTTDGQTAFEGLFTPGQTLKWEANELLIVEASNGAGLTASVNGQSVGVLGPRGQLAARAWAPTGEIRVPPTPTAAPPTPSPTP